MRSKQGASGRDVGCAESTDWDAESSVPRHPDAEPGNDEALPYGDWAGGFLDETTLIGSTVEGDEEWGEGRHWIIDTAGARVPVRIAYPAAVDARPPVAPGDGTWVTAAEAEDALSVWELG